MPQLKVERQRKPVLEGARNSGEGQEPIGIDVRMVQQQLLCHCACKSVLRNNQSQIVLFCVQLRWRLFRKQPNRIEAVTQRKDILSQQRVFPQIISLNAVQSPFSLCRRLSV